MLAGLVPSEGEASERSAVIDRLAELADCGADRGSRFHVDATYGGTLVPMDDADSPKGVKQTDSISVDFHKLFFHRSVSAHSWSVTAWNDNDLSPANSALPNLVWKSTWTTWRFNAATDPATDALSEDGDVSQTS